MFRECPAGKDGFDHCCRCGTSLLRPGDKTPRRAVGILTVSWWHVVGVGGVLCLHEGTGMGSNPVSFMETLDDGCSVAHLDLTTSCQET